jgi:hypothetical protein
MGGGQHDCLQALEQVRLRDMGEQYHGDFIDLSIHRKSIDDFLKEEMNDKRRNYKILP